MHDCSQANSSFHSEKHFCTKKPGSEIGFLETEKTRSIFFPQLDIFAVGVYAFQINKQMPISCKDLTWKDDQLIAFPSSQEQQMLHRSV